jgi:cell division protein FtsB
LTKSTGTGRTGRPLKNPVNSAVNSDRPWVPRPDTPNAPLEALQPTLPAQAQPGSAEVIAQLSTEMLDPKITLARSATLEALFKYHTGLQKDATLAALKVMQADVKQLREELSGLTNEHDTLRRETEKLKVDLKWMTDENVGLRAYKDSALSQTAREAGEKAAAEVAAKKLETDMDDAQKLDAEITALSLQVKADQRAIDLSIYGDGSPVLGQGRVDLVPGFMEAASERRRKLELLKGRVSQAEYDRESAALAQAKINQARDEDLIERRRNFDSRVQPGDMPRDSVQQETTALPRLPNGDIQTYGTEVTNQENWQRNFRRNAK